MEGVVDCGADSSIVAKKCIKKAKIVDGKTIVYRVGNGQSLYTQARESPETDFRAHRRTATNFCAHRHTASPLARTESMDFQCLRLLCCTMDIPLI